MSILRQSKFRLLLLLIAVSGISNLASADVGATTEVELITDALIRVGGEPVPILFKDNSDCIYKGRAYAERIGSVLALIASRTCGNKNERGGIGFIILKDSKVIRNNVTREQVNKITKGTMTNLFKPDDISRMSSDVLKEIVVSEIFDAHARNYLAPTCEELGRVKLLSGETTDSEHAGLGLLEAARLGIIGREFYYLALFELGKRHADFPALAATCKDFLGLNIGQAIN